MATDNLSTWVSFTLERTPGDLINIGSNIGLKPSGNKPLLELVLPKISDAIWYH